MVITKETTVYDVKDCPFIGIVDMPIFMHVEIDEFPVYDPINFERISKKTGISMHWRRISSLIRTYCACWRWTIC